MLYACQQRNLTLHAFRWRSDTGRAGLVHGALYLVRPDGHVALADADGRASAPVGYLDLWHIRTSALDKQLQAA